MSDLDEIREQGRYVRQALQDWLGQLDGGALDDARAQRAARAAAWVAFQKAYEDLRQLEECVLAEVEESQ